MNNPYLLSSISKTPAIIASIVRQVPESRWDEKVDPDRFSFREGVAHLADWEPIMLDRTRIATEGNRGTIQGFDEDEMALKGNYATSNPVEQAQLLQQRRLATIAFYNELDKGVYGHTGVHTERGEQSVYDLLGVHLGHDVYHIDHLAQYLP